MTDVVYWRGDYFITRALYDVELLYSLGKRKFITPIRISGSEVEYSLFPSKYVLFWPHWERGRNYVVVEMRLVKIEREEGIRGRKEEILGKVAWVKFSDKRTLFASSEVPQQVKDVVRMATRPPSAHLFRIVYSEEEHRKLLSLIDSMKEIDLTYVQR
jgi:ABC-type arginine transport system ATPase subunit